MDNVHWNDGKQPEKGLQHVAESILERNGKDPSEVERDLKFDIAVGLGHEFTDQELEDFNSVRSLLNVFLNRRNSWGTPKSTGKDRKDIMAELGGVVKENKVAELRGNSVVDGETFWSSEYMSIPFETEVRYENGEPLVQVSVDQRTDQIPYYVRQLGSNPEPLKRRVGIKEESLDEVDYGSVFTQAYHEVLEENLRDVSESLVDINMHEVYENLDGEDDKFSLLDLTLEDPSPEELSEVQEAIKQAVLDIRSYNERMCWNIVGESPYRRDNVYVQEGPLAHEIGPVIAHHGMETLKQAYRGDEGSMDQLTG